MPGLNFTIYRRDRDTRAGGCVLLAVKNNKQSIRRPDLEYNAELLKCELRSEGKRKILVVLFYRPPDSDLDYLKELKKSLLYASRHNFDKLLICDLLNLPNVNWSTCTANSSDSLRNYFTKLVKDNFLWQIIGFPTRNDNILDLILTNSPEKIVNVHSFDDLIFTDDKLISFDIDMCIPKKIETKRVVYSSKMQSGKV